MTKPPCKKGEWCDAPCCYALVLWDDFYFEKLLRNHPDILGRYDAKLLVVKGSGRNFFAVIPNREPFLLVGTEMGAKKFMDFERSLKDRIRSGAEETRCVFLGKDRRCDVYDLRPTDCWKYGEIRPRRCEWRKNK